MASTQSQREAIGRERYGLDVASAEVLAFALHQVSVQMQQALVRSAFSARRPGHRRLCVIDQHAD